MTFATDIFEQQRTRLLGIAYRMLGSKGDAEDMVQEAWLRWQANRPDDLESAQAWLTTAVTRLSIDRLRKARLERASYFGPWLPEPLGAADINTPEAALEFDSDVSIVLLTVLETLSAEERAAFILHDIVDDDYCDIAEALGKSEANCRQMVHRARQRLSTRQRRFAIDDSTRIALLQKFMDTVRRGDRQALLALLAADAVMVSDGGGKATALHRPLIGAQRISWLWYAVARRGWPDSSDVAGPLQQRIVRVNGEPGIASYWYGKLHSVAVIETDGSRIYNYFSIANPDKLRAFAATL